MSLNAAPKVYTTQQRHDAEEAWERWINMCRDMRRQTIGHPLPFIKLYTALMEKADADRELLRWLHPDHPEHITDTLQYSFVPTLAETVFQQLTGGDINIQPDYGQFLVTEYIQRVVGRFTQITLPEQLARPRFVDQRQEEWTMGDAGQSGPVVVIEEVGE